MPMVMTKSCGTLKMRSVLSRTWCRVVSTRRTARETEDQHPHEKDDCGINPLPGYRKVMPNTLKEMSGSPGVTTLKIAGMTIKSEKNGTNRSVLLRKKGSRDC